MATETLTGIAGSAQAETVAEADTYKEVRDDLECQTGKLSSLDGFLAFLANAAERKDEADGDEVCAFWSLKNLVESIHTDTQKLVERMIDIEWRDQPADAVEAASGDFWPRTFEEWSAAVAENDGNSLDTDEDRLYSHMLKCHTATAGDAALKMRVVLHSLFVSDARSQFPDQCAALSDVVADLERIAAAGNAARRAGKAVRS